MAKSWLSAVVAITACCFAVVGCEDNPDQYYKQAPPGAGDRWNNGNADGFADPNAKNGFRDSFNTTTKQELCSGPVKQKTWSKMVNEAIKPPRNFAGLDLAGGEAWTGLDFRDAEKVLCQSKSQGGDESTLYASWGDADEVLVSYKLSNNTIDFVQLNQGYRGSLDFASRPDQPGKPNPFGQHTYSIGVGRPVQRDGKLWELNWGAIDSWATELYDAVMYTYAPTLPGDQTNCVKAATCLAREVGGGAAVWGARPIGIYLHVPSVVAPPPAPSTPNYMYAFYVKLMPFSTAEMFVKLDQEGPTAKAPKLGDKGPNGTDCVMKLGQHYSDFMSNCVNVLQDSKGNDYTKGKLLGGLTHTKEDFKFSVEGVNLDFSSNVIGQDGVIGDSWEPAATDEASQFILDIRASGKLLNEYSKPDPVTGATTFTFGGTAAIYREYARIVQNDLHRQMKEFNASYTGYPIGDANCLLDEGENADTWKPAKGCTGFEGFMTPASPDTTEDVGIKRVSLGGPTAQAMGYKTALKPGDPIAMFCADAGVNSHCGIGDYLGYKGSLFDGSYKRVLDYLGEGDPLKLPASARDRKYYFKLWARAVVKYLKAAHTYPTDLSKPEYGPGGMACGNFAVGCEPEPDHLIFDQVGLIGDREKFEYIDRRFVTADREPTKYEYEVLLISGNQQDSRFIRRLTRPERALYWSMAKDKVSEAPGAGNELRITNLVGSPILMENWLGVPGTTKDAHYCATNLGTDGNGDEECIAEGGPANTPPRDSKHGNRVLLDDYGNPLLTNYRGAFTGTAFTIGSTHLRLTEIQPFIKSAKVAVPNFADPYNPFFGPNEISSPPPPKVVLADWRPKTPADGIRIPVNEQRDRFIPSATVNFSGSSLSLDIDYDYEGAPLPDGSHVIKIEAVQSDEYMGNVFLCRDPVTNDLLTVEQYESMETVMTWIALHPGVYDACNLMIRFSAFNNFPVLLAAKKAGIVLNVGQGSGVGRITHIEMYDPSL